MLLCFIVDGHQKNQTVFQVQHNNTNINQQSPLNTTETLSGICVEVDNGLPHGKIVIL